MNRRIPRPLILGLFAAMTASIFWVIEHTTGLSGWAFLTVPFKLALVVAFPLVLPGLSSLLEGRPRVAVSFGLAVVAVTCVAAAAYLPWRDSFADNFGTDTYRWYHTRANEGLSYPDVERWLIEWRAYRPHLIEFGVLVVFNALVIGGCYFVRLDRTGGLILSAVAYVYLLVIPPATGLVVWTYDLFLRGIAFDSISVDLLPLFIWSAADASIFLYVFMLIFFAVAALFFLGARPRKRLAEAL